MRIIRAVGFVSAVAICTSSIEVPAQQKPVLPPPLDDYVTKHVKLTPAQRSQLLAGQPVTRALDVEPAKEVAVFGAVWVDAPVSKYVSAVTDIESFEKGANFRVTKRLSEPPRIEDFAELVLPAEDVADLKECRVGACELKLGEASLARIRKEVDWSKPTATKDAEAAARRLMLEYVTGYAQGGNAKLAVYRDSDRPTFVAEEFRTMIERMPALTEYLPSIKKYLLEYPQATLPNAQSLLYWQEAQFGLKPTIRVNHLVVTQNQAGAVIASKMLYASHYFWTALELRVLVADPARGKGFWFVSVNQSRSDGLSGFVGSLIRGKVRGEAEKGMAAVLKLTKTRMEQ